MNRATCFASRFKRFQLENKARSSGREVWDVSFALGQASVFESVINFVYISQKLAILFKSANSKAIKLPELNSSESNA